MAPALKVTHLLALTLSNVAPSLRLIRLSVGPTFSFRIERYSLMKDVRKVSRSVRSQGLEYLTAPLVSNQDTWPVTPLMSTTARTGIIPSSFTYYASSLAARHESISILVPFTLPQCDVPFWSTSSCPHRL